MYSTGGEHLPFPALAPGTPAPRPTTDSRALGMTAERERRGRAMKRARASVADRAPMGRHAQAPQFCALHRPAVYIRKYTVDVPPQ